jgi:TRAP-type uncharacterized transport system substrate-binding protein
MVTPKIFLGRMLAKLTALFGRGMVVSMGVVVLIGLVTSAAIFLFINSAAPSTITITSGPAGSSFQNNAEKYKTILARDGVTLKILPSEGSVDNLKKLSNPKVAVDVGFVLGGEVNGTNIDNLYSLGSISYQPLMIFYRGVEKKLLSDFKGLRLDIGPEGSGTHSLALTLLKANGVEPNDGTVFADSVSGDSARALLDDRIDAIFVMGDSTSSTMMRELLHASGIRLFSFAQADAYTRRISYLNKLELPRGALDFGKDIPAEDTYLIGPTVEIIARGKLHPALSDMLIEVAQEVHGTPGIFKKRGEFPAAQEHEFRLSADAIRYYKSGKTYLYRTFPFAIASLIARIVEVIVPVALLLIPALKAVPAIYRWRMEYRINRWYRGLLDLERQAFRHWADREKREELLRRLGQIESTVNGIAVPAKFGSLFYGLREHIGFVRSILQSSEMPVGPPLAADQDGGDTMASAATGGVVV